MRQLQQGLLLILVFLLKRHNILSLWKEKVLSQWTLQVNYFLALCDLDWHEFNTEPYGNKPNEKIERKARQNEEVYQFAHPFFFLVFLGLRKQYLNRNKSGLLLICDCLMTLLYSAFKNQHAAVSYLLMTSVSTSYASHEPIFTGFSLDKAPFQQCKTFLLGHN